MKPYQFSNQDLQRTPLTLSGVSKTYADTTVVENLSFSIQPGEILGLLGPNGAGKSTTINMIAGVIPATTGRIEVFGFDSRQEYQKSRRLVGVMHQEPIIEQYLNVEQSLKIHSGYYGVADDPVWRKLIVEQLELGPHLAKRYLKLSGGMRRRFMIAKTLLHKPRLLILDEPTAGVDVELRERLWSFVREINKAGISVLLTTHYLEEAEQMCDRIAFMNMGKLVALEETKKLISRIDKQKLRVELHTALREMPDELKSFDSDLDEEDSHFLNFSLESGAEVVAVVSSLEKIGLEVLNVTLTQPDLEDVFKHLSRESGGIKGVR